MIAGLENISENNAVSKFDIETPVYHIKNLCDSSNTIKYPIIKHILVIHGYPLKEDTIEALRVAKDAILHHPS